MSFECEGRGIRVFDPLREFVGRSVRGSLPPHAALLLAAASQTFYLTLFPRKVGKFPSTFYH